MARKPSPLARRENRHPPFPQHRVLDLRENQLRAKGALDAGRLCCSREGFERLELDGNWIQEEALDTLRDMFASGAAGAAALGSLEDNDEEGYDEEVGAGLERRGGTQGRD